MTNYLPLILGMTLVTYIPRYLPLNLLSELDLNPKIIRFLTYIPYTSLSILIIRGLLTASKDMFIPSLIGILVAGVVSWFKGNLVVAVFLGIFSSFLAIQILI
ncbi:MAG: AzlD domain-containing protein [Tissierellia bacterium]|nr:AzlD domain-containing protein [Tissierellia bacterium]